MGKQTHGHTLNYSSSPTYSTWANMMARCRPNPARRDFKYYAGKGIQVCERWHLFANFLEDMGEKPEGQTLDRINAEGNYEKINCRWATWREQRLNVKPREFCSRGHKMEGNNIRWDKSGSNIQRTCRTCANARHQAQRKGIPLSFS